MPFLKYLKQNNHSSQKAQFSQDVILNINRINQQMSQSTMVGEYCLTEEHMLGSGSYSTVYLAESETGKKAAIKKVKKSKQNELLYKTAKRQANILFGLKSPNICELIGTHDSSNHFYLIQTYQQGKTLAKLLKQKKRLSFPQAEQIFKGLLKALEYLVPKGIMHRDLKPQNIIIRSTRQVILIDFGFACRINKQKDDYVLDELAGSPIYMSPELLGKRKYNSKSDIWSLGVILFQMIHGFPPFNGKSYDDLLTNIKGKKSIFISQIMISKTIKFLIQQCLVVNPQKRINWKELFAWKNTNKLQSGGITFQKQENQICCCSFFSR